MQMMHGFRVSGREVKSHLFLRVRTLCMYLIVILISRGDSSAIQVHTISYIAHELPYMKYRIQFIYNFYIGNIGQLVQHAIYKAKDAIYFRLKRK
jgi:hypothetical protein